MASMTGVTEEGLGSVFVRKFCKLSFREILFIIVVVLTQFGCNITLDLPGALQDALMKNFQLSAAQFSLTYSLYYFPKIIFNGINGYLIDKVMGIKMNTLINCIISIVGCLLFSIGGIVDKFWIMLLGRFIFGLGNEMATGVCINYCMFAWYRNSIINLISSLFASISLLGTLLMYQAGPRLIQLFKQSMPEMEALNIVIGIANSTFLVTAALAVSLTYMKPKNVIGADIDDAIYEEKTATLKDILQFPAVFWLLCFMSVVCGFCDTFSQFSQGLLTSAEFQMTVNEASNAVTVMEIATFVFSIPISMSVDMFGRNTTYIVVSFIFRIMAFLLFLLRVSPYVCMVLVGISSTIYTSAILPMFAYPVENHLVGSCYGIMSTVAGVGAAGAPAAVGAVIDKFGYDAALYLFFVGSVVSLLCALLIWILDKRASGVLNMTPNERIHYEQMMESKRLEENASQPNSTHL